MQYQLTTADKYLEAAEHLKISNHKNLVVWALHALFSQYTLDFMLFVV